MITIQKIENKRTVDGEEAVNVELRGLSTDTKPTEIAEKKVDNGSLFIEMDTGEIYFYDLGSESWVNGGGSTPSVEKFSFVSGGGFTFQKNQGSSLQNEITNIKNNVNMSSITTMNAMFAECPNLTSVDLTGLDTSNVTDMSELFYYDDSLSSVTLGDIDTSKVTKFNGMFAGCEALEELDVSSIDTSSATGISSMFSNCSLLTSLDIDNFNTENVTNMNGLFYSCEALEELDVSNLDTSNVTNIGYMFYGCRGLTSLDVSNFNTENVENMNSMFYDCDGLTSLDLSSWDTSNVRYVNNMFQYTNLTFLDVRTFEFSSINEEEEIDAVFGSADDEFNPNCLIVVKDATEKAWVEETYSWLTNVQTVAEYEA